jgi:hypothetical protein
MRSDAPSKPYLEWASVEVHLLGFDVESNEFCENLGLNPTFVKKGMWCLQTACLVSSSDVNEHLRYVLRALLPIEEKIEQMRPNVSLLVSIGWGSNALGRGSGPTIDADCVVGLARLGASLAFSIAEAKSQMGQGAGKGGD